MADEPQGAPEGGAEPDYKAKYEEALKHSREWERRAKENKAAADELEKARQAGKSAEEQIADLTRRLDEKERAEKRAALAAKVAKEKGVPADLIAGDDEKQMSEWAERLAAYGKPKSAAKVSKPGTFDREGGGGDSGVRELAKMLLGND